MPPRPRQRARPACRLPSALVGGRAAARLALRGQGVAHKAVQTGFESRRFTFPRLCPRGERGVFIFGLKFVSVKVVRKSFRALHGGLLLNLAGFFSAFGFMNKI